MRKKLLKCFMVGMMGLSLVACGQTGTTSGSTDTSTSAKEESGKQTIGLCMPTQSAERWINDASNMKKMLEEKGYRVDVQFAEDDPQTQVSQVENFVAQNVNCLVIAAVDSGVLVNAEAQAKDAGIPIIAYDRLLMNTDAVSYYATFDNVGVGRTIGNYIKEKKSLEEAKKSGKSYTIEFFMGSPDDNNAVLLYKGIMEVLKPYLDDGTLVCKSNRTSFEETSILRWSQETAQANCENILTANYADDKLDIACSAYDGFSYGIKAALLGAGYEVGSEEWPLITGQDSDIMAVKNIIEGSQTMSIYKDTRLLADKCSAMIDAVLKGTEPEINNQDEYNNGNKVVPTYMCEPQAVDSSNYKELLIDGGYYTEDQLK